MSPIAGALGTQAPTPCVLVVDDERINRELLRGILKRAGYDTILANSGEEALAIIRGTAAIDLVLLDVVMEPMSGFAVLKEIRQHYLDTELPVVMVTAESERKTIISAFRDGANDYVTKPLDPEITLARVSLQLRLRRAQADLERSQERYQMAAQGSRIGLWDWDVAQRQIFLSPRWKEMLGFADHELVGDVQTWFDRIHQSDREHFLKLLAARNPDEFERFECELRMLHRDGSFRWMQCSGVVQSDAHGQPRRLAGSLADITEGKVRDVLTGLPNRLLFEERIEGVLRRSDRQPQSCAVLFLDLDKFKLVNDSLGHDVGDLLLRTVAQRLENCLDHETWSLPDRASVCIARHGGDEFTVLLCGLSYPQQVEQIAASVIEILSEPCQLGIHEVSVGVSIGIAYTSHEMSSSADVVCAADTAMYCAKMSGRGRFRIYDPEMQTKAAARLTLENEIRQALKLGQFYLAYQPIVQLATGRIDGFEALCRWNHPRGEMIGPDVFIPVLESLGLIGQLGRYVLEAAGRQILEWNTRYRKTQPLTVTVNCSTREFTQPQFRRALLASIGELGVAPGMIRLEVTESTLMDDPEATLLTIQELRAAGLGVGLDDFGTGYSSLSYLHRLPLDLLKIDKSFIRAMLNGEDGIEIVRTIISSSPWPEILVLTQLPKGSSLRNNSPSSKTSVARTHKATSSHLRSAPKRPVNSS